MQIAIVYSSRTGNTAQLAAAIKEILPEGSCKFYGALTAQENATQLVQDVDLVFVGFWTDKGTCDEQTAQFLQQLEGQRVFLFGTAGFGGDHTFFETILNRVGLHLSPSNTLVGTWMCQGKMPLAVRKRYETMQEQEPEKMQRMIANFDLALTHPDDKDVTALQQTVCNLLNL